jgi:hypothetical protein
VQAAFDNLQKRKANADTLTRTEGATPDDQRAAQDAVKAAQKEFDDQKLEFENQKQKAERERREVRAGVSLAVLDQQSQKANRLQEEARKKADDEKRAADLAARQAEVEARRKQREDLQNRENNLDGSARTAGGRFSAAGGKVGGKLGASLQGIGDKLADGTNQAEIDKLAQQFQAATQGMGGATIAALKAMLDAQKAQAKEIETLRQQIRNK